jgi:hypothetical protein
MQRLLEKKGVKYSHLQVLKMPLPHSPVPASPAVFIRKTGMNFSCVYKRIVILLYTQDNWQNWRAQAVISIHTLAGIIIWTGKLWNMAQWALVMLSQGITRLYSFREHETMPVRTHSTLIYSQHKSRFNPTVNAYLSNTCNFWLFLWTRHKSTHVLLSGPLCCFLEACRVGFMILTKFFGGIWQLVSERHSMTLLLVWG